MTLTQKVHNIFLEHQNDANWLWDGICPDDSISKNAEKIFSVGINLIYAKENCDVRTLWSESLPRPSFSSCSPEDENTESFFVAKANSIFMDAVAFVLRHEVAHLNLAHERSDSISSAESITQERDADNYAIEMHLKLSPYKNNPDLLYFAPAMALVSLLFLPDSMRQGTTHPDFDLRFNDFSMMYEDVPEKETSFVDYAITIAFASFLSFYTKENPPLIHDRPRCAIQSYREAIREIIDSMKSM